MTLRLGPRAMSPPVACKNFSNFYECTLVTKAINPLKELMKLKARITLEIFQKINDFTVYIQVPTVVECQQEVTLERWSLDHENND